MTNFGKNSTAHEVIENKNLHGKVAIVTGGNSGMGLVVVKAFANAGARVLMCCRNLEAGKKAAGLEVRKFKANQESNVGNAIYTQRFLFQLQINSLPLQENISVHALDLEDFQSVKAFSDSIAGTISHVDILICNAGALIFPPKALTAYGFERGLAVNHFGHQDLTGLLLPKLIASGTPNEPSRIIFISSFNHIASRLKREWTDTEDFTYTNRKYDAMMAYADAKMANVLYVKELSKRLTAQGAHVIAVAIHPGMVLTGFADNIPGFGYYATKLLGKMIGKTPEQGAATTIYAAVADGVPSGAYLENCSVSKPSPIALDEEFAKKFYDRAEAVLKEAVRNLA